MFNVEVKNMDIAGLVERADQIMVELLKSQSADIDAFRGADRARADVYMGNMVDYAEWAASQPELDLPESSPRTFNIDYLSERDGVSEKVENKAIRDLARMMQALIIEMSNSQSARAPSGIIVHDLGRFNALIAKMRAFLTDFVDPQQPTDLPETNPSEAGVTSGRLGT